MKSNTKDRPRGYDINWPVEGLEYVQHCPVCGKSKREQLYSGLTDRVFGCAPGRWDLYQCKSCRSAYLDPRPTLSTIYLAYQTYYTHQRPTLHATEELSGTRRLVRSLANGYRNYWYRSDFKPSNPLGPYIIGLLPSYRKRLDREMRFLPPLNPGGRLLDVGFGSGAFMAHAESIAWKVSGVDPDSIAVANARSAGLDTRQGGIEAFSERHEQFDVITMSHVIEHVHDPV